MMGPILAHTLCVARRLVAYHIDRIATNRPTP